MVKVRKLTRQDLIDEIDQLRQQVIELQSEIIRLKQPNDAPWQPYVYPYYKMPDDTTGDPLPAQPNITICDDMISDRVLYIDASEFRFEEPIIQ